MIITKGADHLRVYYSEPPRQSGGSGAAERHQEVTPRSLSSGDGAAEQEAAQALERLDTQITELMTNT